MAAFLAKIISKKILGERIENGFGKEVRHFCGFASATIAFANTHARIPTSKQCPQLDSMESLPQQRPRRDARPCLQESLSTMERF
jgi:hypothetical protein